MKSKLLKQEISKILVKWDMPTRQVAIDEIVELFESELSQQKEENLSNVTRLELIDYTAKVPRSYVVWDESIKVTQELQDDGRTLKVFVRRRE